MTVAAYLAGLPADRRAEVARVRRVIRKHLPKGYKEGIGPRPALAAELKSGFKKAGKKLDMGKSCIRFRRADDLDLDTIGRIVGKVPVAKYVAIAQAARRR